MLLETVKLNFKWYLLPSLSEKTLVFLGLFWNGIGSTTSFLPGHWIVRLNIFTSGSLLSDPTNKQKEKINIFFFIMGLGDNREKSGCDSNFQLCVRVND